MGLFTRKNSKIAVDAESLNDRNSMNSSNRNSNSSALKTPMTPMSARTPMGKGFGSLSLPDVTLPRPPDPYVDPAAYLRSIYAVRERTRIVYERARRNQLLHFDVDMGKFGETAAYVVSIIKVCTLTTGHVLHSCCMCVIRRAEADGCND